MLFVKSASHVSTGPGFVQLAPGYKKHGLILLRDDGPWLVSSTSQCIGHADRLIDALRCGFWAFLDWSLSTAIHKCAPRFHCLAILSRSVAKTKNPGFALSGTRFFGLRPQNDEYELGANSRRDVLRFLSQSSGCWKGGMKTVMNSIPKYPLFFFSGCWPNRTLAWCSRSPRQ